MTKLQKQIHHSLIEYDRDVAWLAGMFGKSRATLYKKLREDQWDYKELSRLRELFHWQTLEG